MIWWWQRFGMELANPRQANLTSAWQALRLNCTMEYFIATTSFETPSNLIPKVT